LGVETTLRVQPRCQKTARAPVDRSTTYCTPLRWYAARSKRGSRRCRPAWSAWRPVSAHIMSARKLQGCGHDARLMPTKYVRAYSRGQKNDFRDAENKPMASSSLLDRTRTNPAGLGRWMMLPRCAGNTVSGAARRAARDRI